nr:hypothetical protein [Acetobacter conturbans]
MAGSDPRAGDNIDIPPERAGRNIADAAEAEERHEREANYTPSSRPDNRGQGYEPAPYAGTALPKPGSSNVTPDTEVSYGRADKGTSKPSSSTGE